MTITVQGAAAASATRLAPRRRGARVPRRMVPWLFLAPAMAMFALYVLWPIGQSIALSFYEWDGFGEPAFVGTANYVELADDPAFYTSLHNNAWWLLLSMLAPPIGLGLALFLNQQVFGIRIVKSLYFFPFVISPVVVGLVFTWFYDPAYGILTLAAASLGYDMPSILSDPDLATFGIIAASLWPSVAYCMILYLTGLASLDAEQIEAGRLDGARSWRMLWYVVLPQLRPATFLAVVVTVIGALRSFDLVATMTNGGPFGSTRVLAFMMYEVSLSEYGFRMGYGAAIAVVLFAIMMVYIAWFLSRMLRAERGQ